MYVLAWQFVVKPGAVEAFRAAYGPAGDWAALFGSAEGYHGTELLRDERDPTRFVTLDRWASRDAWKAFRRRFAAEYAALDARCDALTSSETPLGAFEAVI